VKEERNILRRIKRRKATCIGHILRRNCLLKLWEDRKKDKSDGKTRKNSLKEMAGYRELKQEALDRTL
jgi:hypothetical protein